MSYFSPILSFLYIHGMVYEVLVKFIYYPKFINPHCHCVYCTRILFKRTTVDDLLTAINWQIVFSFKTKYQDILPRKQISRLSSDGSDILHDETYECWVILTRTMVVACRNIFFWIFTKIFHFKVSDVWASWHHCQAQSELMNIEQKASKLVTGFLHFCRSYLWDMSLDTYHSS